MTTRRLIAVLALAVMCALAPRPAHPETLAVFDGFSAATLDPARWRGYEHTIRFTDYSGGTAYNLSIHDDRDDVLGGPHPGVDNIESRREVVSGQARLALTTASRGQWLDSDHEQGTGRLGLRLSDIDLADGAPSIRVMQARVTVLSVDRDTTCTYIQGRHRAGAGIFGTFFNDGSSTGPGDRTGDISAAISVYVPAGGDGSTTIGAKLFRCSEATCSWVKTLMAVTFNAAGHVGDPHLLTIRWQPELDRFVATVKIGAATPAQRALSYSSTATPSAPAGYVYDLRAEIQPGGCTGPPDTRDRVSVSVDARFDNVRLYSDTAIAAD